MQQSTEARNQNRRTEPKREWQMIVKCQTCNGSVCQTPGFVRHSNGNADRAELIRAQIELSRLGPKHRELFVADGAGKMMEKMGVEMHFEGDGHYSVSNTDRGLSIDTFTPGERVDIYADRNTANKLHWMRGLKYVRHTTTADGEVIVFRKDEHSGPWAGTELAKREKDLIGAHPEWCPKCPACDGMKLHTTCTVCLNSGRIGTLERGFLRSVTVPRLADVFDRIAAYGLTPDKAVPTPWACELIRDFPTVERVVCSDQQPTMEEGGWEWYGLPDILNVPKTKQTFATRENATDALGECVTLVLKELVGT